ncbi:hypothetical protein SERLADRAFT_466677, partial [Serpula lacrymans var. lacrymans S7.9]
MRSFAWGEIASVRIPCQGCSMLCIIGEWKRTQHLKRIEDGPTWICSSGSWCMCTIGRCFLRVLTRALRISSLTLLLRIPTVLRVGLTRRLGRLLKVRLLPLTVGSRGMHFEELACHSRP